MRIDFLKKQIFQAIRIITHWSFISIGACCTLSEIAAEEKVLLDSFREFDRFQGQKSRRELEDKLRRFLQKEEGLSRYFSFSDHHFTLYKSPEEGSSEREIEYQLSLREESSGSTPKPLVGNSPHPLLGKKIAIDPGHFGGRYARLEARYIDIYPSLERKEKVEFNEGTLSYLTALYLKLLLEKEGAIVFLTRDGIEKGAHPQDFFTWLKEKPELWHKEIKLSRIFQTQYNPADLRARAEKINAFAPDLTVVIHYNSHHGEGEDTSNSSVTAHNYNLMFIPGAFCRLELSNLEHRFEFLRLLLTDDIERSLALSRSILQSCSHSLHVPIVQKSDGARYLNSVCLELEEGIYARNLAMTRLVHSPVCYGETLVQNHVDECRLLNRQDFVIGSFLCSSRLKEVAEAYFTGIKKYLEESGQDLAMSKREEDKN